MKQKITTDANSMENDNDDDDNKERTEALKDHQRAVIDEHSPIISDDVIPDKQQWSSFIANKRLYPEFVHYYTTRIIKPHYIDDKDYSFRVPLGKVLYLWGGNLATPSSRKDRFDCPIAKINAETYENSVFFVGNELSEDGQHTRRTHGRCAPECFNLKALQNIKEGELAVMHLMTYVPYENITILSPDGDLIFLLLMACRDRIDPVTGQFRNSVKLRLVTPNSLSSSSSSSRSNSKTKKTKDDGGEEADEEEDGVETEYGNDYNFDKAAGNVEEIDINLLYTMIMNDQLFHRAGINDPISILTAVSVLIKNDYIFDFGYGLGTVKLGNETNGNEPIPTLLAVLLKNPYAFRHMVRVISQEKVRGTFSEVFPIYIDEDIFMSFARECYVLKYGKIAAKAMSIDENDITVENVRYYLYKIRGKKNNRKNKTTTTITRRRNRPVSSALVMDDGKEEGEEATTSHSMEVSDRSIKNRMLVARELRVFARQLLWVLNYWQNGYRKDAEYPICPLSRYSGMSYYGYVQTYDGLCIKADIVSALTPRDRYEWFLGKPVKIAIKIDADQKKKDKAQFQRIKQQQSFNGRSSLTSTIIHERNRDKEEKVDDEEGDDLTDTDKKKAKRSDQQSYKFIYNPITAQKNNMWIPKIKKQHHMLIEDTKEQSLEEKYTLFKPSHIERRKLDIVLI
jgi:hypothetical protein